MAVLYMETAIIARQAGAESLEMETLHQGVAGHRAIAGEAELVGKRAFGHPVQIGEFVRVATQGSGRAAGAVRLAVGARSVGAVVLHRINLLVCSRASRRRARQVRPAARGSCSSRDSPGCRSRRYSRSS